ncbi:hypothetical protein P4123_28140 [Pseudomonas aeruginosa]|nr:hypothetical protein [Pseudomonas aeruginosa]
MPEGHGGGGIDLQAGGVVERSIDQLLGNWLPYFALADAAYRCER